MKTNEQIAAYVFAARDEYIRKQEKKRSVLKTALPLTAAALTLVSLTVFGAIININGTDRSFTSNMTVQETVAATAIPETGPAIYLDTYTGMQVGWDEMPAYDKFRSFTHDGKEYRGFRLADGSGIIPENAVGEKLYDVTMSTIEMFSEKEFTINAQVYAITDIQPEAAVAVRFEGTDEYCSFRRGDYCLPATLGELIDELDLMDSMSFGNIWIPEKGMGNAYYTYDPIPVSADHAKLLMQLFEECRDIKCESDDDIMFSRQVFSVTADVEKAGIANRYIGFMEDGYMITNIMEYAFCFNIGTERVQRLEKAFKISEQTPHIQTFPEPPQTTAADDYYGEKTSIGTVVMYTQDTTISMPAPQTISE